MEINFSFGPNCLHALAAQGSAAPSLGSPRCYRGSGPDIPSTQLYFTPNYTCLRPTARTERLWGVIPEKTGRWDSLLVSVPSEFSHADSNCVILRSPMARTCSAPGFLHHKLCLHVQNLLRPPAHFCERFQFCMHAK